MSYSDLQELLDKVSKVIFTSTTQHDLNKLSFRESVRFSTDKVTIEISGHSFLSSGVKLPEASYRFSYGYFNSNNPISGLDIDFSNYSRTFFVSGSSPEQVDALSAMLEKDLLSFSSSIGGSSFQIVISLLKLILVIAIILTTITCIATKQIQVVVVPIFLSIILFFLNFLPFDDILSGFAVYAGDSSIFIRYGPQITFWGVVITIIGIPLSYLLPKWLSSSKKA